jgi:hypothetical protein
MPKFGTLWKSLVATGLAAGGGIPRLVNSAAFPDNKISS